MRFTDVKQMDHRPDFSYASYVIPYPEGTDAEALEQRIKEIMESDSLEIGLDLITGRNDPSRTTDIRDEIMSLELRDGAICMKIRTILPPYTVYRVLLDIPWETAGRYRPVCTEVEYE